jgi:hypothetical protein
MVISTSQLEDEEQGYDDSDSDTALDKYPAESPPFLLDWIEYTELFR